MPYSHVYMKRKIEEHYRENITIAKINGKPNVQIVTFTTTASKNLHDFHQQTRKDDSTSEKTRVIETAAKLIKSDFKLITHSKDHYPTSEEMSAEKAAAFVPESLRIRTYFCRLYFL